MSTSSEALAEMFPLPIRPGVLVPSRTTRARRSDFPARRRRVRAGACSARAAASRESHFAYLRAELGGAAVSALVRRDGTASGHYGWLRLAERLLPPAAPVFDAPSSLDPLTTVLCLTRTCDQLTELRLCGVGDRGIYPSGAATASIEGAWSPLTLDVDEWGELNVVRLRGELDFASVPSVRETLDSVSCSTLQLDLAKLSFCDAAGLSAIVAAKHHREDDGCHVTIVGAQGIVRRVFEVTGLADELAD